MIYNDDCLNVIKAIPDKSVDLVVTDPPYILETQGAGFFGKKSDEYSMNYKGKKAYTWGGGTLCNERNRWNERWIFRRCYE